MARIARKHEANETILDRKQKLKSLLYSKELRKTKQTITMEKKKQGKKTTKQKRKKEKTNIETFCLFSFLFFFPLSLFILLSFFLFRSSQFVIAYQIHSILTKNNVTAKHKFLVTFRKKINCEKQ